MRDGDEFVLGAPGGLFSGGSSGSSPSVRAEAAVDVALGCIGAGVMLAGGIAGIPAGGLGALAVINGAMGVGGCLVSATMLGLASDRDLQAFGKLTGMFSFNGLVLGSYGVLLAGERGMALGSRIGNLADNIMNFSSEFSAQSYERTRDLWFGALGMMGGIGQMDRATTDMVRAFEAWGNERYGGGGGGGRGGADSRGEGRGLGQAAMEHAAGLGRDWDFGIDFGDRGGFGEHGGHEGGGEHEGGDHDGGFFGGFFGGGGGHDKGFEPPGSGDRRPVLY